MKIVHRLFIAVLAALAIAWIWTTVSLRKEIVDDNAYYNNEFAPKLAASQRQSEAFTDAIKARQRGKNVPLPTLETLKYPDITPVALRAKVRIHNAFLRDQFLLGFKATVAVWAIFALVQGLVARKQFESPERPALPGAGKIVGELVSSKSVFIAKAEDEGVTAPQVQIDGRRSMAIFRNFRFVTSFIGNPMRDQVEVPFKDLIVGTLYYARGKSSIQLRTVQGQVSIGESVQPFKQLVSLLQDVTEQNRTFPGRYEDALSRELKVQTPWYGWAILVLAISTVGAAFWWLVIRN